MSAALMAVAALVSGCGISSTAPKVSPVPLAGSPLQGSVHGGQQPVTGASLALYAAATTGYSGGTANILSQAVSTDAAGNFDITGMYNCVAGQQMYLVATGGNAGAGFNQNLALMAAVGDCAQLSASTQIIMNEVTTVGSVFALAPFMNSITALGTTTTNTSGLAHAFASVNKLVNVASGTPLGSALPSGATGPVNEIRTLANILAACINSAGGTAGSNTSCGQLFTLTTSPGAAAPADTIQAALNIAHNPTLNVASLFALTMPQSPFQPQLSTPPGDWTLAISYAPAGLNQPTTTTIDRDGSVWVANTTGNSVSVFAQTGEPMSGSPFTANGLQSPAAIAIDAGGNAWVANSGGNSVSAFTSTGAMLSGSPFAGNGTINAPNSVAIDALGDIWIANVGNNSVTELSATGSYLQQVNSGFSKPSALAINPK